MGKILSVFFVDLTPTVIQCFNFANRVCVITKHRPDFSVSCTFMYSTGVGVFSLKLIIPFIKACISLKFVCAVLYFEIASSNSTDTPS